MNRAEKGQFVEWLNQIFNESGSVVVAHYSGLTVAQLNILRSKMRDAGGSIKVAKNRLAKIALENTETSDLSELFVGQTIIAYSSDPISAPKVAVNFAKEHANLVILGGAMGKEVFSADGVKSLASLPSIDELRAKIVGMISTPATRVAQVINAPASQLARVFNAYAQQ